MICGTTHRRIWRRPSSTWIRRKKILRKPKCICTISKPPKKSPSQKHSCITSNGAKATRSVSGRNTIRDQRRRSGLPRQRMTWLSRRPGWKSWGLRSTACRQMAWMAMSWSSWRRDWTQPGPSWRHLRSRLLSTASWRT